MVHTKDELARKAGLYRRRHEFTYHQLQRIAYNDADPADFVDEA